MSEATHLKIKSLSPVLIVADLERSISFYTAQLGFTLAFRYEDFYAGVIKDGLSIHLKLGEPLAEVRERNKMNQDIDITFSVFDVDGLYNELSGKPVEIIQPLRQMPYGKEFYIADPDGYIHSFLNVD